MHKNLFTPTISLFLSLSILLGSSNIAQAAALPYMPPPGTLVKLSAPQNIPCAVGMKFDPANPLKFTFIIDKGNGFLNEAILKEEGANITRYFLSALAIPEKELWVNLSPYEHNRIIDNNLAQTDLGKDMLGTDYLLKQLAASLTHPNTPQGEKYWDEINNYKLHITDYKSGNGNGNLKSVICNQQFSAPSALKVWIIPGRIHIYEEEGKVYVDRAPLKVMCEEDYFAQQNNFPQTTSLLKRGSPQGGGVAAFKQHILPLIEQEVNHGASFAKLRQFYRAIILASWFKAKLRKSFLNSTYFNQHRIKGIDTTDPKIKEQIYQDYLKAFEKGAYNLIKTDRQISNFDSRFSAKRTRTYFSGGEALDPDLENNSDVTKSVPPEAEAGTATVDVECQPVTDEWEAYRARVDEHLRSFHPDNLPLYAFTFAFIDFLYPRQILSDEAIFSIAGIAHSMWNELAMGESLSNMADTALEVLPEFQEDGSLPVIPDFNRKSFVEFFGQWKDKVTPKYTPDPMMEAMDRFFNRDDKAEINAFSAEISQVLYGRDITPESWMLSGIATALKDRLIERSNMHMLTGMFVQMIMEISQTGILPALEKDIDVDALVEVFTAWQNKWVSGAGLDSTAQDKLVRAIKFFDSFMVTVDIDVKDSIREALNPGTELHHNVHSLARELAEMISLPQVADHKAMIVISAATLAYMLTYNDVKEGAKRLAIIMQKMQENDIGSSRNVEAEEVQALAQRYFTIIKQSQGSASHLADPFNITPREVVDSHMLPARNAAGLQVSLDSLMRAAKSFLQEEGITGDLDNAALEIATLTYYGNVAQAIIEAGAIGVNAQKAYAFLMPYAQSMASSQKKSPGKNDHNVSCGTMTAAGEKDLRLHMRRVYEDMRRKLVAMGLRTDLDTNALTEKEVTKAAAALGLTGNMTEDDLNEILDVLHDDTLLKLRGAQVLFTPAANGRELYYAREDGEGKNAVVTYSAGHFSMRDGRRIHIPPQFLGQFKTQQLRITVAREIVLHELGHMQGKTHDDKGMDIVSKLHRYLDASLGRDKAAQIDGGLNFASVSGNTDISYSKITNGQDSADIDLKKITGMDFKITAVALVR